MNTKPLTDTEVIYFIIGITLCIYVFIQSINFVELYYRINYKYYRDYTKKDIVIQLFIPFYIDIKKTIYNFKNNK